MASIFDLHIHTTKGSPDSSLTPEELVAECKRVGLTGAMVTEHNGWPRHDFDDFARAQDIVLVRGLELYTPLGHIIALGLEENVVGFGGGIEAVEKLRREVDRVGGYLILAHPFRFLFDIPGYYKQNILFRDHEGVPPLAKEAADHPIFQLVHEVEVVNGGNIEVENRFAEQVAAKLNLRGTGGSDAHSMNGVGKGTTVFPGEIRHARDLLDALRANEFFPLEGYHVGRPVSYHEGFDYSLLTAPIAVPTKTRL
jgi:predicted metal-dependent phosphoesterase TrpH